jgi:hypothetical protein
MDGALLTLFDRGVATHFTTRVRASCLCYARHCCRALQVTMPSLTNVCKEHGVPASLKDPAHDLQLVDEALAEVSYHGKPAHGRAVAGGAE